MAVPFQSSINRTWEIRTEKTANQAVSLKLTWLSADDNNRNLLKAQVWESADGLLWTGVKPLQNLQSREVSLQTRNLHHFTISGSDLRGELRYLSTVFEESGLNNGSISNPIYINLLGDYQFNAKIGEDLARDNQLKISNLPSTLRLEAILISETEVELRILGLADKHESSNSISNLGIQFLPQAFKNGNPNYIAFSDRQDLQIRFRDQAEQEVLGIYPNPTPDRVTINLELSAPSKVKISLYQQDRLLQTFEDDSPNLLYQNQLDLSALPQGLYLIKIETAQNVFVWKVVRE